MDSYLLLMQLLLCEGLSG